VKIAAPAAALGQAIALTSIRDRAVPTFAHLAAKDGQLSITSCDSGVSITATLEATITKEGQITISADRMANLINACPADASVTMAKDRTALAITTDRGGYRLAMADMPNTLAIEGRADAIEISTADCLRLLEPVAVAGTESSRFYLTGCYWHSDKGSLVSVASNGVLLIKTSIEAGFLTRGVIVPSGSIAIMGRLVKKARPERVTLRQSDALVELSCPAFTFRPD
jgi:DNA polymerase III sliding clamp (beta) subunit (PCNA family)